MYRIVVSLLLGKHVVEVDFKAVEILRQDLERKRGGTIGLDPAFRAMINDRTSRSYKGPLPKDRDEAVSYLMRQWDMQPFTFNMGSPVLVEDVTGAAAVGANVVPDSVEPEA